MNASDMARRAKSKAQNKIRDSLIESDRKRKRSKFILDPGDGVSRVNLQDINEPNSDNYYRGISSTNYIPRGSDKENEMLDDLKFKYNEFNLNMVDFYKNNEAWLLDNSKSSDAKSAQMRYMNRMYQRRMLSLCASPLSEGLKSEAIIESVGMFIGFYASSPDARKYVKDSVCKHFADTIDKRSKKGGLLGGYYSSKMMSDRRDKYLRIVNNGRVPLTEETAALTDISIKKEYYEKLRSGDYDSKESLKEEYDRANRVLDKLISEDGLDSKNVRQKRNVMIGRLIETDPDFKHIFSGFTDGSIRKADYHTEELLSYDAYGKPFLDEALVWTGEFEVDYIDENGRKRTEITNQIDFEPREPISESEFTKGLSKITGKYFDDCGRNGNLSPDSMGVDYLNTVNNVVYNIYGDNSLFKNAQDEGLVSTQNSRESIDLRNSLNSYISFYQKEDGVDDKMCAKCITKALSANNIDLSNKLMYKEFGSYGPSLNKFCMQMAKDTYNIDLSDDYSREDRFFKEDPDFEERVEKYGRENLLNSSETAYYGAAVMSLYGYTDFDKLMKSEKADDYFKDVETLKSITNTYKSSIRTSIQYGSNEKEVFNDFDRWAETVDKKNSRKLNLDKEKIAEVDNVIKTINSESNKSVVGQDLKNLSKRKIKIKSLFKDTNSYDYKNNPINVKEKVSYNKNKKDKDTFFDKAYDKTKDIEDKTKNFGKKIDDFKDKTRKKVIDYLEDENSKESEDYYGL